MKEYKRLFTFGCSYTRYEWPTWANIIAMDMPEVEFYNYGGSGLGNVAIQYLMLEADLTHNFNDDDLILVAWTGWSREDRFHRDRDGWSRGFGNVTNPDSTNYDNNFVQTYWSYENDIIRNASAIIFANKQFNITYQAMLENIHYEYDESNASDLYGPQIESLNIQKWGDHPHYTFDVHPTVLEHMNHVAQCVYPALDRTLSQSTIDYFEEYHRLLENIQSIDNWSMYCEKIYHMLKPRLGNIEKRVQYRI